MNRDLRVGALVMAAGVVVSASVCLAGPEDHTRRGLGRSSTPAPAPAAQSGGGNDSSGASAPAPAASAPAPSAPAPAATPAPAPTPAPAAAPSGGLVRGPGVSAPGDGRPARIGTPQNPATVDETRRALALPTRASGRRVAGSIDLPSGAETMRSAQRGLERPSGAMTISAPGVGTQSRHGSGSSSAFVRASDNTVRDLHRASAGGGPSSHGSGGWNGNHGGDWRRHGHRGSWYGGSWYGGGFVYDTPVTTFDPWTNWSNGLPVVVVDPYNGIARDPWSYSQFNYTGPGWYPSTDWSVRPYEFSYHPYLGEDVWAFETSTYPVGSGGMFADPYAFSDFSGGLTGDPPVPSTIIVPVAPSVPTQVYATTLPRVNSAYDVRADFQSSVEAALGGEFSASIYSMRRAAGVNPAGLVSGTSATRWAISSDPAWGQRVRAALLVFQNPPTRVVSETDAQFMVAALSAAMGDEAAARAAVNAALSAGDAAGSTALLDKALRGEPLESSGPWVTGRTIGK